MLAMMRRRRQNKLRRVGPQNIRELWAALALIREAVEDCAPPGSVPNSEYLLPEPGYEAEASAASQRIRF
jgi:hypothetical protein